MLSLSDNNQADQCYRSIEFVSQIYHTERQLNKAKFLDTEAPFLYLGLSITNSIVSSKIHDK